MKVVKVVECGPKARKRSGDGGSGGGRLGLAEEKEGRGGSGKWRR